MIKKIFHQVLLHVAGSAVSLGLSPCIGATGACSALLVEVHHGAGASQALAKALWCWLTDRAWMK